MNPRLLSPLAVPCLAAALLVAGAGVSVTGCAPLVVAAGVGAGTLVAVDRRSAAVAGIDGGVGLHERDTAHRPDGAHDAAGHGALQDSQRRTDSDHLLAAPHARRGTQREHLL